MQHAEKYCRKFYAGKIPWSSETSEAQLQIELWSLVAHHLRKCRVNTRTILRKKKHAGFTGNTNVDLKEGCDKLQASYNMYREVIKDRKETRVTFIIDFAITNAKAGKIKTANALRVTEQNEEHQASWSRIHRIGGTIRSRIELSRIIAPDVDDN